MRLHEHTGPLQLQFYIEKNRAFLIFFLNKKKHGIYIILNNMNTYLSHTEFRFYL